MTTHTPGNLAAKAGSTTEPVQHDQKHGYFNFTLIWLGQLLSMLGSGLTNFALGVAVYMQTGSATQFTLIYLFAALPGIIIMPLAGTLADRWHPRRTMILGNLGAGLSKLVIVALLYMQRMEVWQVYVAVIAVTVFSSILGLAYTISIKLLVPKQHYGRASGMTQTAQAAAQIIPPLVAGFMIESFQLLGVLLIDFATYLFAIATLLIAHIPARRLTATTQPQAPVKADTPGTVEAELPGATAETADAIPESDRALPRAEAPPRRPMWHEAGLGWTYIKSHRGLLGLLIYFAAVNFVLGSSTVLFTPLVLNFATARELGFILSISGFGFLSGSLLMSVWGGTKSRINGVLGFGFLFGVCSMLVGLRPSVPLIAASGFAMFMLLPIINGNSQAIWLAKTPTEVQGRVFAVRRMIGASTVPIAYLFAGPLADRVFEPLAATDSFRRTFGHVFGSGAGRGIGLMFIIAGFLVIIMQLGGYLYLPLRHLEKDVPDAAQADTSLART